MKYLGLIALLVLSACGGSTSYEDHTPVTPPPPPPPLVTLDAFYSAVLAFIGDGSESSAEPMATDTVVATAPEDTEPVVYK